nr:MULTISPECIES: transposase [unclassified Streptomyces]
MARLGEAIRRGGAIGDRQIVPEAVASTIVPGAPTATPAACASPPRLPTRPPRSHTTTSGGSRTTPTATINWKTRQVRCPAGRTSSHWNPVKQHGKDAIVITFSVLTCRDCPLQKQCTASRTGRRMLTLRPEELHENLARARAEQKTDTRKNKYALRAGVEGTINQALDITGFRRARYRGLPKVRLHHAFSATALNVIRLDAHWTTGPLDRPRTSRLERLSYRLSA